MKAGQRQKQLLISLLVIWGGVVLWNVALIGEPKHVPLVNVSGPAQGRSLASGKREAALNVKVDLLTAQRVHAAAGFTSPKNIFDLYRQQGDARLSQGPDEEHQPQAALQPTEPTEQPGFSHLAQIRYLGYLQMRGSGRAGQAVALLVDHDMLHTLRAGERLDETIVVKSITPTEVTLQETHSQAEQRLSLEK